jgi:cell division protein FtsB
MSSLSNLLSQIALQIGALEAQNTQLASEKTQLEAQLDNVSSNVITEAVSEIDSQLALIEQYAGVSAELSSVKTSWVVLKGVL